MQVPCPLLDGAAGHGVGSVASPRSITTTGALALYWVTFAASLAWMQVLAAEKERAEKSVLISYPWPHMMGHLERFLSTPAARDQVFQGHKEISGTDKGTQVNWSSSSCLLFA